MSEFGERFSVEPKIKLPENTIHLAKDHLLYTDNLPAATQAVILVTGYPEGPGILADLKPPQTLNKVISHAQAQDTAFIQVYLGSSLLALKALPQHINQALELVKEKPTTLAVFSFGAQSLRKLEIPETVHHLVLISPVVSPDCLQGQLTNQIVKAFRKILSLPTANEYRQQISPLINFVKAHPQVSLDLILANNDTIVKSPKIKEVLMPILPHPTLREMERDHVPSDKELINLLFSKT